jgi:hypothetical protein
MFTPPVKTVSILSAATDSAEVNLAADNEKGLISLLFLAPTTLPETITIQLTDATGGTFRTLQTGGADITIGAGKAVVVTDLPGGAILRLHAGVGVAAQRDFVLYGANKV